MDLEVGEIVPLPLQDLHFLRFYIYRILPRFVPYLKKMILKNPYIYIYMYVYMC